MNNYLLLAHDRASIEHYLQDFIQSQQIPQSQVFRFGATAPIPVEEFRQVLKLSQVRFDQPSLFVLEGFDNYSDIIQNTFLKTLEEHQATITFVLVASNIGGVLPTIISRCTVKILTTQSQDLSSQDNQKLETEIKQIKLSGMASSVVKLGLKDKKQKALAWLKNFLKFGCQKLPTYQDQYWLAQSLKQAMINYTLIKNNNLDPETALDQVFLS